MKTFFIFCSALLASINCNNIRNEIDNKISYNTAFSYENVLENYYKIAIHEINNPSKTFEDFYDEFYSNGSDRDLLKSTKKLAIENNNLSYYNSIFGANIDTYSSGGDYKDLGGGPEGNDASYILKSSTDYSHTYSTYFARKPLYTFFDYSALKAGDIVYETETILFNAGHNAIITDTKYPSDYGKYVRTIEAIGSGVSRGFLDDQRIAYYKCKILRVKNYTEQKASLATNFANAQIGKPYSIDTFRLNTSINSTKWYCSELVYACWYYAGINIGVKKDSNNNDVFLSMGCLPKDINDSYNVKVLDIGKVDFLGLSVIDKKQNKWSIKISNNTSSQLAVEYNSKMCFYNDAKKWTNLSDVKKIYISSESYAIVTIEENWFATSITTSFMFNGFRLISYADNLNSQNNSLVLYSSII